MLFVGFQAIVSNSPTAAISYRIWYGFYLVFLMKELQEKTLTWNYIFTTLWSYFSKTWTQTLSTGTVPTERVKLSVLALSFTLEFLHPHVSAASFHILMSSSIIGTRRDSFSFLRVPLSQNECFMKVKLSVFRVNWVSVIAPSRLSCEQSVQDLLTRCENFGNVFIVLEKFIDQLETKMTDVDPSIVR